MNLPPELMNVCLVVEGFPPESCPVEVARKVSFVTGSQAEAVAPLPAGAYATGSCLLRLHSHDEQKRYLQQYRTIAVLEGMRCLQIKFHYPQINCAPRDLDWVVLSKEEEKMDSVATEDMYGNGDDTEVMKTWKAQTPSKPPEAQMFSPAEYHRQQPQYVGQEPGFQSTQPKFMYHITAQRHESDEFFSAGRRPHQLPNMYAHGFDPRSAPRSDPSSSAGEKSSHPQQANRRSGILNPDIFHYPGQYTGYSPEESNPIYPATQRSPRGATAHLQHEATAHLPQGATAHLQHAMSDLKLDQSYQHLGPYMQQPGYFYGANMDPRNMEYQAGEDSRSKQRNTYLKVTELPDSISECELKEFFQNRQRSGGGPVTRVSLDRETKSAAIVFDEVDDVQRVILKAPLLLKEKKIFVEEVSRDRQEEENRTVEIRGLQTEDDSEMCTYYFENPTKGGGDIECSKWNDAEKIFLITFKDAAVAKAVVSKGHKLAGKVLEVSLYTPPADDADLPQCTVLVRGFDPSKRDLYEVYFSKGGDEIVDLRVSEDETAMYITFETPEVAERIARKPHYVSGRQLEVIVAPVERPTPSSTVIVTGCDLTDTDIYQYYFQNRKRGGGDFSNIAIDGKAIHITFIDPEVAQRLDGTRHKIGNCNVQVSLYTPQKSPPKRLASQESVKEEAAAPLKTVVVAVGQHPLEHEELYTNYFENPRFDGGEVEAVNIDEEQRLVYVTFSDPAVATRMAAREHKILGRQVEVKLHAPPKPDPKKLLFKNVADSTTRDCLCMYLERVTGLEPQEILYGDEVGTVLITFDKEPDLATVTQLCQKKTLEHRKLIVSQVPISNCLLVENISAQSTDETIQFYFENKRSKGGPVERVEMVHEEKKCFVYFKDHEVLDGVLSKEHKLDSSQLVVKRYIECLGESGGSEDPTAFTLPKPLVMDTIDPYKVAFLRQVQTAKSHLFQQLSSSYAHGKFTGNSLAVECTLTVAIPKARILAQTWAVDVKHNVETYVSTIEVYRREVVQQLWQEVERAVNAQDFNSLEEAVMFSLSEERAFVVVGFKSTACNLFERVTTTIKSVEEEIERKNQEVTETNNRLKNYHLCLLLAKGYPAEEEKRYQGLKVEIQLENNSVVFHGLLKHVKDAQVDMYELLQRVQTEKITKLSDTQIKVLKSKETKPYIAQKFGQEKVVAAWESDSQNHISIFAFDDASLVKAIHIIKKSVPEHICDLSPESVELLHGSEWKKLTTRLTTANPGILLITSFIEYLQVFVTCIDDILHETVEEIEVFLQENSIYSKIVRFSPSRQLFIQQEWHQRLIDIQKSLQAYRVQITMKEAGTELYVKGTNQGLVELQKKLEDLNTKIICHEERFTDLAKVRCLNSPHTERDLKVLGQINHCVVTLTPETADVEMVQSGNAGSSAVQTVQTVQDTGVMNAVANVQLANGVTISAVQGDITQLPVDAIVNAANNRMDHIGGLARDIVQKGGDSIQQESYKALKSWGKPLKEGDVLMTGAGKLHCKAVLHACGPVYRGGHSGEDDSLHETILNCICLATEAGHSSIAFPAISTGIFRYPPKEAARVITEAVKVYLDSHKKPKIRSVYLCHISADIALMFADAIRRVFPSARSLSGSVRNPLPSPGPGLSAKGATAAVHGASAQRVISIAVVEGEIAKFEADVIVNSSNNGLDLKRGSVSISLLKVAGDRLQDECLRKYPNGIATGTIARTAGHNLSCKEVYHLVLSNWSNPNAQQILGGVVIMCLTEASKQQYESIAFPVLGVGVLAYPSKLVAETMIGAIDEFQRKTPTTSLRKASIVIYPASGVHLKQEFEDVLTKIGRAVSLSKQQPSSSLSADRQARRFASSGEGQASSNARASVSSGSSAVYNIGKLKFIIKQGDITEEATDAIVNSTNPKLDLNRGNVANALKDKCGPELVKECARKVPDIQQRGITSTKAYKLKSRLILHINSEKFANDWGGGMKLCLEEAESQGVETLAMPALGTGAYGRTPYQSATALFQTLTAFISGKSRNLKELRVVLYDITMIPPYVSAIEELGNKEAQNQPRGIFKSFKSASTGSGNTSVKQTYASSAPKDATLYIYAGSRREIPKILQAFDNLVQERVLHKEIVDDILVTLSPREIEQIHQLKKEYKVEITVQQTRGRVLIDGLQDEVFETRQRISQILREVERSRQEVERAAMLANMVQWFFLAVHNQSSMGNEENQIIEQAYQNKKKNAEIIDAQGVVYVIDFNSMKEYPRGNKSDAVDVLRRDKIREMASGALPDYWADHSANEHVKVVSLKPTDPEYKKVEANFKSTLGNVPATIKAIDRIQNRTLYQQYVAKKTQLENQNTGIQNEKTLWHGTGSEAIENINNYGFNRSYCGKNATAYGAGVYFAVNTNYSAQPTYSPPDASGNRYIYQCKVLVGHCVKGRSNLRVLPPRSGPVLYDSATNDLKNIVMYVIFNDTQAYPEYLITFQ